MSDFSFVQITDHHLLETEETLRDGFCPGHAFRMVMRHISQNDADKVDFIISTGDLVEPDTDATYQGAMKLLGITSSAALPGPQHINIEGLKDFPMYFLPGNHDPLVPGSVYLRMRRTPNLHVLGLTHDEAVVFERLDQPALRPLPTARADTSRRWPSPRAIRPRHRQVPAQGAA